MKTYQETLEFLYAQLPVFETQGAHAYKPGLERCEAMDTLLGHPHRLYRTIHVAGTNGKGSCSHTLASILQCAGYRVGLFTSPHLLDFDERIRVDGEPVDHDFVVHWVADQYDVLKDLQPSFFELATMMAFSYFAAKEVDVAVIEVGLGGRLDSTNIITPELCLITNISYDHMQLLGDTLPQIAAEKAGIMKRGVPCVVGECTDERVHFTLKTKAEQVQAPLVWADMCRQVLWVKECTDHMEYETLSDGTLTSPLMGDYQPHNANTVLTCVHQLRQCGFEISEQQLHDGMRDVLTLTHLRGRWETLQASSPLVIADTGHNEGCFAYLGPQLQHLLDTGTERLHIVFGMVRDKDITAVLKQLPHEAHYYFCQAPTARALPAVELQAMAQPYGLQGKCYPSIVDAYRAAMAAASPRDAVFVGGSNYIVCEVLRLYPPK